MREKLIKLIASGSIKCFEGECRNCEYDDSNPNCQNQLIADFLIKNGVVIPPCKVGDTVYQTDGVRVYESTIKNVIYVTEGVSFDKNAIGKSIFLTRKDAEKESEE